MIPKGGGCLRGCTDCGWEQRDQYGLAAEKRARRAENPRGSEWTRTLDSCVVCVVCVFTLVCMAGFPYLHTSCSTAGECTGREMSLTHTLQLSFLNAVLFWLPGLLFQALWTSLTCHQAFQLCSMPSAPSSCYPWAKLWCQILNMLKALPALAINIPPLPAQTGSSFLSFMPLLTLGLIPSWQPEYPKCIQNWWHQNLCWESSLYLEVANAGA